MPEHPVDEGAALTLHCRTASSFNQTHFYKDQLLIGSSSTGNFTIQPVSESSEGSYTCRTTAEESRSRRLTVRGESFFLETQICHSLSVKSCCSCCRSGLVTDQQISPSFTAFLPLWVCLNSGQAVVFVFSSAPPWKVSLAPGTHTASCGGRLPAARRADAALPLEKPQRSVFVFTKQISHPAASAHHRPEGSVWSAARKQRGFTDEQASVEPEDLMKNNWTMQVHRNICVCFTVTWFHLTDNINHSI